MTDLKQILRELPEVEGSVRSQVMARIEKPRRVWIPLTAAAVAMCAVLVVSSDEFTARGKPASDQGMRVHEKAGAYSFEVYRSRATAPYTMLYAIDSAREVHWFYPAYTDVNDPPRAASFTFEGWQLLPDAVHMDGVAQGPLTFVLLTSNRSLDVGDVEKAVAEGKLAPEHTTFTTEVRQ